MRCVLANSMAQCSAAASHRPRRRLCMFAYMSRRRGLYVCVHIPASVSKSFVFVCVFLYGSLAFVYVNVSACRWRWRRSIGTLSVAMLDQDSITGKRSYRDISPFHLLVSSTVLAPLTTMAFRSYDDGSASAHLSSAHLSSASTVCRPLNKSGWQQA